DLTGSPIASPGVASAEVQVDRSTRASRVARMTGVDAIELRTVSNGMRACWDTCARRTAESGTQRSAKSSREAVRAAMSDDETSVTSKVWHPAASSASAST